jgi:excinuclease ABC subunit C
MKIEEKVRTIPHKPGVYMMKDREGQILYIGKAKNLQTRVSSYFHKKATDNKTLALTMRISDIETIMTDNEVEALVLENNLIKRYKPKFNIELKENNQYPYLKLTSETFPRIVKTRIRANDGAVYFGPYTKVKYLNSTIKTITDIFPIRRCTVNLDKKPQSSPCINYYLKKCTCPCCGYIDRDAYSEMVAQVTLFLKGQNKTLLGRIKNDMETQARNQRFERAIELRERYKALTHLLSEQKITTEAGGNEDIIGIAYGEDICAITVLKRRDGKIIGKNDYTVHDSIGLWSVLDQFLPIYYEDAADLPQKILLSEDIENPTTFHNYLKNKFGKIIQIRVPKKGMNKRLVQLACRNARQKREEELYILHSEYALEELKKVLHLGSEPKEIEAFDIATTLGKLSVASMVRFTMGKPDKKNYRKFRIKYVDEQNDVEMIKEAVARRYQRLVNEGKPIPDLVLVDGGGQQVRGAREILDKLGLRLIPVIGLAKKHEDIYTPEAKRPIRLEKRNKALRLLMAIRDEAHRFANSYHIKLRSKDTLLTKLMRVRGIGDSLASNILSFIETSEDQVTIDILQSIKGLGSKRAAEVYLALHDYGQHGKIEN